MSSGTRTTGPRSCANPPSPVSNFPIPTQLLHRARVHEDSHTRQRVPRARARGRDSGADGVHRWCPPNSAVPSPTDVTFALPCSTMAAITWHRCGSMRQWMRAKDMPVKFPPDRGEFAQRNRKSFVRYASCGGDESDPGAPPARDFDPRSKGASG